MVENREIQEFIKSYVEEIENSNAAIFAGAGLSRPAGYVDWKELLRGIANDIQLNVDLETDLISLAQYHYNEYNGRHKINQVLIDEFTKSAEITKNHEILANLPIGTYWTTNYDQLIETSLEKAGKNVDKKIEPESLSNSKSGSNATVYKMHGDISLAHKAVLIKDDYEDYNNKRELFTTALRGDLVSKTFLFVGISFDDPNLSQILGKIRILLGENSRSHYCIMKKINKTDFEDEEEYRYESIRQELRIKDLKRYHINVVLINEYTEITDILQSISNKINRKNVFISGSASYYKDWDEKKSLEFSTLLSKSLIRNKNNIVTGFGLGIGSCIISGALEEIYSNREKNVEERLKARPFPQKSTGDLDIKTLWHKYRKEMISNAGIAIFIFGNKYDHKTEKIINADGLNKEYRISIENGAIPIPVGATEFMARELWDEVMGNFDELVGIPMLKPLYKSLGDKEKTAEELVGIVIKIINELIQR